MDSAISYARASQDRAGQELSVDRQHEDHRDLARKRNVNLVDELTDNDVSANGRRKRPSFEETLKLVRTGRANIIIATDMSRLTRGKAQDEARLLELGLETGLRLWFVNGSDLELSSAAGRLTASILIAAARHEIEQKSERQRRAAIQAAQRGVRIAGRRAFGYGVQTGVDPITHKPIIDYDRVVQVEADALRRAYSDCLRGVTLTAIARELNEQGLVPTQGKRDGSPGLWTAANLRPVLLNPRYAGLRHHTPTDLLAKLHPIKARLAGIVGPAAWPAVIDEPTWRAVVAKLVDPSRTTNDRSERKFLTGIAVCGAQGCGAKVHGGGNHTGASIYRCSANYGHLGRRSAPVDAYVEEFTVAFLRTPEAVRLLRADEHPNLETVRVEMLGLRERLNEQAALHAEGIIDTGQLRAGSALLRRRLDELGLQMMEMGRTSVLTPLLDAADPQVVWDAISRDRKRAVVEHLFEVTVLSPGRGVRAFRPETVVITRRAAGLPH